MQVMVLFQPWCSFEGVTYYHWQAIDPEDHGLIRTGTRYHRGLDSMRLEIQAWAEASGYEVIDSTQPSNPPLKLPARRKTR